jgi:hypothetical protein
VVTALKEKRVKRGSDAPNLAILRPNRPAAKTLASRRLASGFFENLNFPPIFFPFGCIARGSSVVSSEIAQSVEASP